MVLALEVLANAILLVDADGHCRAANAQGRAWLKPLIQQRRGEIWRRVRDHQAGELVLDLPDGKRLRVHVSRQADSWLIEAADFSETDALRRQLREAEERVSQLNAAHEELRCAYESRFEARFEANDVQAERRQRLAPAARAQSAGGA